MTIFSVHLFLSNGYISSYIDAVVEGLNSVLGNLVDEFVSVDVAMTRYPDDFDFKIVLLKIIMITLMSVVL